MPASLVFGSMNLLNIIVNGFVNSAIDISVKKKAVKLTVDIIT